MICIPPSEVDQFWPHVRRMLLGAVSLMDISRSRDIEDDVMNGRALLWIVWNGRSIEAAVITQLMQTDKGKVCVVVSCAGLVKDRWIHLLREIEGYAKEEGCRAVRLYGRKGWLRVLPDYKQIAVVIEKGLA